MPAPPSMLSGLGALILPVSIFLLILRAERGPVAKFLRAGAVSADTARRPASLGIGRLFLVQDAVRHGVLVAVGDGRYFVDLPTHRRRRRRAIAIIGLVTVAAAAGLLLWSPWR